MSRHLRIAVRWHASAAWTTISSLGLMMSPDMVPIVLVAVLIVQLPDE